MCAPPARSDAVPHLDPRRQRRPGRPRRRPGRRRRPRPRRAASTGTNATDIMAAKTTSSTHAERPEPEPLGVRRARSPGTRAAGFRGELRACTQHPIRRVGSGPVTADPSTEVLLLRLDPDLPAPAYAHPGDAGADLVSRIDVVIPPQGRVTVPTGRGHRAARRLRRVRAPALRAGHAARADHRQRPRHRRRRLPRRDRGHAAEHGRRARRSSCTGATGSRSW